MINFKYGAFIPSLKTHIQIRELTFAAYKQLVKIITNDNNVSILEAFDNLIVELCDVDINTLTFLDKVVILLTIRSVCIFPVLELSSAKATHSTTLEFNINNIIDKINNTQVYTHLNHTTQTYKDLRVTYGIPKCLFYSTEDELVLSTIKLIELVQSDTYTDITDYKDKVLSSLPATIYVDAKQHIQKIEEEIKKHTLLSIRSMDQSPDDAVEVTSSILNNSSFELLKISFQRNLFSLYELEYFLTSKLNIPYEVVSKSTYAELSIYIGIYNEEQKKQREAEKATPRIG